MKKDEETGKTGDIDLSRRRLLTGAGVAAAALSLPAAAKVADKSGKVLQVSDDVVNLDREHAFYRDGGQVGVHTPMQRHGMLMTFNFTSSSRQDLQVLLARWSAAIAQMMKGETIGKVEPQRPNGIGLDTGEALNLSPASLTVTIGLGPRLFGDAYGLAGKKPPLFRPLHDLPSDNFRPELVGGDLSLQACADDPQVVYHAIRDLARIAKTMGVASTHWSVSGFSRPSAGPKKITQRNLMGFRDGTRNARTDEDFNKFVWIKDGPAWQRNGTYQVVRKVKIHIESWDTDFISDQEQIFGRHKVSGAPLTGKHEFDTPDFTARDSKGNLIIPAASHIALGAHENNGGIKILRRSFNYAEGIDKFGRLAAGLLFICYQNDPAHFERIQAKMGAVDLLNEYITHIGSAVFYIPPAPKVGSYIGKELFS